MIDEATFEGAKGISRLTFKPPTTITVKGKSRPIKVFEPCFFDPPISAYAAPSVRLSLLPFDIF